MYAVYIYKIKGQIIYVGKTTSNLQTRINCHRKEAKFLPFEEAEIYYAELNNATEASLFELALINNYTPILNEQNAYDNTRHISIDESLLKWKLYDKPTRKKPNKVPKIDLNPNRPKSITLPDIADDKGRWGIYTHSKTGKIYQRYTVYINNKRRIFYGKTQQEAFDKYLKELQETMLSRKVDNAK